MRGGGDEAGWLFWAAGTAGTMVANKLRRRLGREWQVTVVEQSDVHHYQPGFLFLPFGTVRPGRLVKPTRQSIPDGVDLVRGEIDKASSRTTTSCGYRRPQRVIRLPGHRDRDVTAAGPDPGMLDGGQWRDSIFDFYTFDGATALREALAEFDGGRLVVHIIEMPIKCPVAPLEFAFLADAYFRAPGMRDRVEIVYVTPLPGAFTKPIASAQLGSMLDERKIAVEPDFMVERIDADAKTLVSYDEREMPFDLLVTVPLNMGADYRRPLRARRRAQLRPGRQAHLAVQRRTTTSSPSATPPTSRRRRPARSRTSRSRCSSRTSSQHIDGRPMTGSFDGHANCFVESGDGKALLIDFNYDTEPLPGTYPVPDIGPFRLLEETRINHWGKLAFRWMYWHLLLPGRRSRCRRTCPWPASSSPIDHREGGVT